MKIKEIKIREDDGSYSDPIPVGADAKYIDMADGDNLQEEINTINNKLDEITENETLENIINQQIFGEINQKIDNLEKIQNPIGMYKGRNLVVFGDSFTDPNNQNSLNGYWVNRVANVTGMTAFNFAKGGASLLRQYNSYRMQVNRAITEMTQTEKDNTSIIIMYLADTDIIENTTLDDYVTEYEQLCSLLVQNFKNAKIIVAPFTWRCNKLYDGYWQKMSNYIWHMRRWTNFPCIFLDNCMYWLLGDIGYYQNEYHPNQNGYMVIADKFINAIYGGNSGDVYDSYDISDLLNLDDQTEDKRCTVNHHNGYVTVEFHCTFSVEKTNAHDWIANFPRIAIPQPDIVAPLMTGNGQVVGSFRLTSANSGRAEIYINNLPANTQIFLTPLTFRAVANVDFQ